MPERKLLARTALLKEEGIRRPAATDRLRDGDEVGTDIGTDEHPHLAGLGSSEGQDNEPAQRENETSFGVPPEESTGKTFRQNAAMAFIFGLAALTLVLIVHLNPW